MYALCLAMVRDAAIAEDLAQETFARGFAAGVGGEAPRARLLEIARRCCLDRIAPTEVPDEPEPVPDQPPPYDILATRDDALRALAVLAERERALVVLHYGHGVGYAELADAFGVEQTTVRSRVARALAKMRAVLRAGRLEAGSNDVVRSADPAAPRDEPAPVLFPALYEEPSPSLWSRLEALRIITR